MTDKLRTRMFYAIFLFSLVFSTVYLVLRRGAGLSTFIYGGGANVFSDFVNNLHYPTHDGGPYFDCIWASFPPLAYVFYAFINSGITRAVYSNELLAYAVITSVTCMLMLYSVQRIFAKRCKRAFAPWEPTAITLCLLLSGVMIYTIERGNSTLNVLVMLLFAFELRDGDSKWQREAALVLIAVAANFKLYPCVFGLLYLFEKRYREAIRLVVYGIVLFFAPFVFFSGVDGFKQFLYNQQEIHKIYRNDYFTSIPSLSSFLAVEMGANEQAVLAVSKWSRIVAYAYGVVLFACVCFTKKMWLKTLLLVCLFVLVPGWSAEYMAIYLMLPFVLFLCEEKPRFAVLYTVLFSGVFILLPFGVSFPTHAPLSWNMLVSFPCIYALSVVAIVDAMRERFGKTAKTLERTA